MGMNSNAQPGAMQPSQPLSPQQQMALSRLAAMQGVAATPYAGKAAGGAGAQGIAQLAAALLARRRQQALLAGQNPQNPTAVPLASTGPVPLQQPTPLPQQ